MVSGDPIEEESMTAAPHIAGSDLVDHLLGRDDLRPGVVVFHAEGAGRSPVPARDVLLVVEVLSLSSRHSDPGHKAKRYADLGIPAYWIIDPLAERVTLTQFVLGSDGSYEQRRRTSDLVTLDHPWPVTLDLPAWTRRRDRINEVARHRPRR